MNKFKNYIKREITETRLLLRSIPAMFLTLFIVSVVLMNILANKQIIDKPWLAADAGYLISWMSFLTMDVLTKHFGHKAANKISIIGIIVNLGVSLICILASSIGPSNLAFDSIFSGVWFILLSSTIAFIISAFVNNGLNTVIGKAFKKNPDGKLAYYSRSYISTFIAQIIDNLLFSILTFIVFGPLIAGWTAWSFIQCFTCAVIAGFIELLFEVVFSPIGYKLTKKWKVEGVGKEYFEYIERSNDGK